ncbi:MAG: bis(5'-nucleosyl)-tetraphosphatase (symmetrical) YqeK [Clostridium fessum]
MIHAKLGAWMAEHKYGITDPEVLSAIACHTTGKPAMSLLDKILYVADYIEPRRDKAPNLPKLRRLAFEDLDEALYQILDAPQLFKGNGHGRG